MVDRGRCPAQREFEVFYRSLVRRMIGWMTLLVPHDGAVSAEDLVQEAFAVAWKNWPLLQHLGEGQRINWMRTTLIRLSVKAGRRQTWWQRNAQLLYEPDLSRAPDPGDAALAAVSAAQCRKAMAIMSPIERYVSVLCWELGYSGAEVATLLDLKEETVRSAKKRARDKLLARGCNEIVEHRPTRPPVSEGGPAR